jgi:hypothetical protein
MKYIMIPSAVVASALLIATSWVMVGPRGPAVYVAVAAAALGISRVRTRWERLAPSEWVKRYCPSPEPQNLDEVVTVPSPHGRGVDPDWSAELQANTRLHFIADRAELMVLKVFAGIDPTFEDHEPDHGRMILSTIHRVARVIDKGDAVVLYASYREAPIALIIAERAISFWKLTVHYSKVSIRNNGIGERILFAMLDELDLCQPGPVTIELPEFSPLSTYYAKFGFQPTHIFGKRRIYSRSGKKACQ